MLLLPHSASFVVAILDDYTPPLYLEKDDLPVMSEAARAGQYMIALCKNFLKINAYIFLNLNLKLLFVKAQQYFRKGSRAAGGHPENT